MTDACEPYLEPGNTRWQIFPQHLQPNWTVTTSRRPQNPLRYGLLLHHETVEYDIVNQKKAIQKQRYNSETYISTRFSSPRPRHSTPRRHPHQACRTIQDGRSSHDRNPSRPRLPSSFFFRSPTTSAEIGRRMPGETIRRSTCLQSNRPVEKEGGECGDSDDAAYAISGIEERVGSLDTKISRSCRLVRAAVLPVTRLEPTKSSKECSTKREARQGKQQDAYENIF